MKKKAFCFIVLIVSIVATWVLISPTIEIRLGINMPLVHITDEQFMCFGYDIPPGKQWGFIFLTGVLLMVPLRMIYVAIVKLRQEN